MKNKPFEMCLLFDFYGEVLTEKQREVFDLYYNEDLSLAEISEHIGITRQGVRDSIIRAEHTLRELEDKLKLVARYGRIDLHARAIADDLQIAIGINRTKYRNVDLAATLQRMEEHITAITGVRAKLAETDE